MGMKTILLSVVLAHFCTATFNDTVTMANDTMFVFPGRLAFNTTDEAVPTPQTKYFIYDYFVIDVLTPPLFDLDSPVVTRFMPSFYILIFLISLPLNVLALVMFTCRIREKKPAVIYMSHLAFVDLLFTLLLPLKIHYQFNSLNWVFGDAVCRVLTATYYCNMYCSILLVMCMSVDRLLAVAFPITSLTLRSTRKASCMCVLVWLLALAGTSPLLSMTLTQTYPNGVVTCLDTVNMIDQHFRLCMYLFSIFICNCFFLPLGVTLVSYFIIIYVLHVKSNNVASSLSSSGKRRRAILMVIAVVIEFVICFGPTNGILMYFCAYVATGNMTDLNLLYSYYMLAVCLGSISVFLDPLLYYYGSSQYRQMIRSVLRR